MERKRKIREREIGGCMCVSQIDRHTGSDRIHPGHCQSRGLPRFLLGLDKQLDPKPLPKSVP